METNEPTQLTKQQLKNKKKREAAKKKKLAAGGSAKTEDGDQSVDNSNNDTTTITETTSPTADTTTKTAVKSTTATKSPPPPTTTTSTTVSSETVTEEVDNFEEELCWCIQQIQIGLQTGKPTKDQTTKSKKLMDQLKSAKTPKPKKRMLMRTTFGDYRGKMEKERREVVHVKPAKFVHVTDKVMNRSTFFRRKVQEDLPEAFRVNNNGGEDEGFRFNFSQEPVS